MHLLAAPPPTPPAPDAPPVSADPRVLRIANDADAVQALSAHLHEHGLLAEDLLRIELTFPKFTDGRAYSQAVALRRRAQYSGPLRATGQVLVDQLLPMQRCGFDQALLAPGQDPALGQRLLGGFPGFYQGDAQQPLPLFAAAGSKPATPAAATATATATGRAVGVHAKPSANFAQLLESARHTLRLAAESGVAVTQASSLGAEDVVVRHLIESMGLGIPAFVLDTGLLHPPTHALLVQTQARAQAQGLPQVLVLHPQASAVQAFMATSGPEPMRQSVALRQACCHIRKVEPLQRALQGFGGWITGLRREQADSRAAIALVEPADPAAAPDSVAARTKYNPLADWRWGDVWHYIGLHQVPYNALHDALYPSIGCAPCTRAISLGEDLRAGRWWWEAEAGSKECGLHVKPPKEQQTQPTASAQTQPLTSAITP